MLSTFSGTDQKLEFGGGRYCLFHVRNFLLSLGGMAFGISGSAFVGRLAVSEHLLLPKVYHENTDCLLSKQATRYTIYLPSLK